MKSQINLIVDERKRQDEKWGADRNLDDAAWLTILMEEVGETCEAILKGLPTMQDELVQVGAVALAWLECVDRRRRTPPDEGGVWSCRNCGNVNQSISPECACCENPRPRW